MDEAAAADVGEDEGTDVQPPRREADEEEEKEEALEAGAPVGVWVATAVAVGGTAEG